MYFENSDTSAAAAANAGLVSANAGLVSANAGLVSTYRFLTSEKGRGTQLI
jgi:hypothetical protein